METLGLLIDSFQMRQREEQKEQEEEQKEGQMKGQTRKERACQLGKEAIDQCWSDLKFAVRDKRRKMRDTFRKRRGITKYRNCFFFLGGCCTIIVIKSGRLTHIINFEDLSTHAVKTEMGGGGGGGGSFCKDFTRV